MPKKKAPESESEQSERFQNTVRDMVVAGELNPIEADEAFDKLVSKTALLKRSKDDEARG